MQKSYHSRVKMIYIDPPYNTGKDFVYKDNYADNMKNYLELTGQDKKLSTNTESDGRYHSNWLNMMYPRLKLARNLLTDDGVIFISIDDNEVANLRKVCDEIFGEENFVAQLIWERAFAPVNLKKHFSESHDYILCFAKNLDTTSCNGLRRTEDADNRYQNPDNDPRGVWQSDNFSVGPRIIEKVYEITTPSGRKVLPPEGRCWLLTQKRYDEFVKDNRIWYGSEGNGVPRIKRFLSEVKAGITPMTLWKYVEVGHSQDATQKLKQLFDGNDFFEYPKPVGLIQRCLELYSNEDSIILDFFSGSATTAHAVMQLNAEDGGNRKYICVQLPEPTPEDSEARKAGYATIPEIAKERIRRAGKKIVEEQKAKAEKEGGLFAEEEKKLDIGFKVFKLDSSNINAWDSDPDNLETALNNSLFNIKEDRNEDDLLYEILIKYGIELTEKINRHTIDGKTVYEMGAGSLIVCLAESLSTAVADGIGKLYKEVSPEGVDANCRVVFKEAGFDGSDEVKTNTLLILKQHGITNVATV